MKCHDCGKRRRCIPSGDDGEERCRQCAEQHRDRLDRTENAIDGLCRDGMTPYEAARCLGINED